MIRLAKSTEIEQIMGITRACAKKMIANNIYQWNEHYPTPDAFKKDLARAELYILEQETKIIGCIVLSTLKDEEYDGVSWLTADSKNLYIHRLAVHPEYQHLGHAKALMDFAEEFARNQQFTSIRLDTFSKNPRNQKFYKNRGYQRLGSIYFPKQSEFPFYCFELVL